MIGLIKKYNIKDKMLVKEFLNKLKKDLNKSKDELVKLDKSSCYFDDRIEEVYFFKKGIELLENEIIVVKEWEKEKEEEEERNHVDSDDDYEYIPDNKVDASKIMYPGCSYDSDKKKRRVRMGWKNFHSWDDDGLNRGKKKVKKKKKKTDFRKMDLEKFFNQINIDMELFENRAIFERLESYYYGNGIK